MTTRATALATLLLFALLSLACRSEGPRSGYLVALDAATGEELWRVETGITWMRELVVNGDTVSVEGTGDCRARSLATHTFSAASGQPISKAVNPSERRGCGRVPGHFGPAGIRPHLAHLIPELKLAQPELLTTSMQFSRVFGSGELVATDRTTGQERWRMDPMEVSAGDTNHFFTAGSDILVFTYISYHMPERPSLASDPDHRQPGDQGRVPVRELRIAPTAAPTAPVLPEPITKTTIVFDANSGAELWRVVEDATAPWGRNHISIDDQTVYMMYMSPDSRGFGGRIEAFEAHTGVRRWQKTSYAFTGDANVAPGDGRLLVANGSLAVMIDAANGDTIWEKPFQPPSVNTEGAIANGVVYVALSARPKGSD